jgi:transcriptional regulator with XRE-family HTH domain
MNLNEFAKLVKTKRDSINVSQTGLAQLMKCSTAAISTYEQGKTLPRHLDIFLDKLDQVVEDFLENGLPERKRVNTGRKIYIGEELDWIWYENDVIEAEVMYRRGIPVEMIARNFGRPILETSIMLAIRAEEGHIEPRESGVYGRVI